MNIRAVWMRLHGRSPFAANVALTVATNIGLAALGMVSGILAARLLGPRGRGELAAIQVWPTFIAMLAMLGMPNAVIYYSARAPKETGRYLSSAIAVALISSLPFMAAGYVLTPLMLHAQAPNIVSAGRWYLLLIPIYALVTMLLTALQGRSDFAPWNAMRLGPNALWIGVLVIAWLFSDATAPFVAGSNLVALALLFLPFGAVVFRRVPGPFAPDSRKLPSMLRYGLPCMMTAVPLTLNQRLDQMLMAALLPPRDLGLYVVAVAWSGAAAPLLNAIGWVAYPAVASASGDQQGAARLAGAVRGTVSLALVLCVILAVITPFAIVILFGHRFKYSVPAALVLVPAAGLLGINASIEHGLLGLGRPYAPLQAELAGLAVTAAALAIMLPPMGIMGAALASLLGYSSVTAVLLLNTWRNAGIPPRLLLLPGFSEVRLVLGRLASAVNATGASSGDLFP